MPTDYSKFLNEIPKRTRKWVHQHVVPDTMGPNNKMYLTPANRAERRAAGRPGDPFGGYMVAAKTTPYEKPQED